MPIEIQELHTEVEVTDPQSVLSPAVLTQVVEAVIAELARREQSGRARASELDLRPVVEQQRSSGQPRSGQSRSGGGARWPS